MSKNATPRRFHFVLTVRWQAPQAPPAVTAVPGQAASVTITSADVHHATLSHVIEPAQGTTAQGLFMEAMAHMRKTAKIPEGAPVAVVHWSLERDEIA